MILTVTLNPSIDRSYRIDSFHPGCLYRAQEESAVAGGKGINAAKVVKIMGEKVTATGFLGGKTGEFIEEELYKKGIGCNFVKISQESRTCIAILDTVLNTQTEILEKGPEIEQSELRRFLQTYEKLAISHQIIIASGSIPAGVPPNIYAEFIDIARGYGSKFILDTSGEYLLHGVKAGPFMIKPNLKEAEILLKMKLTNLSKVKDAAISLYRSGIEVVCISLGHEGSIIAYEKGTYKITPPKVKVSSAVGSGDAYVAGMAVGIKRGLTIPEAATLATACGVSNALYYKTGFIKFEDIKKIKPNIEIERI
ncbi:MAG: 1-phosphofructokinase [Firmicutes bacterium]|jgi:tagatose 6-phosphate kinase|nr:1-phosphofructokinase [Bacillota bacterium]